METRRIEVFRQYLDAQWQKTTELEEHLLRDHRKDEASHEKIKGNIYQIFKTVCLSIEKNPQIKQEEFEENFLGKLETIPQNWQIALDKAKEHEDVERILIEEIKFQVRDKIRAAFQQMMEESDD